MADKSNYVIQLTAARDGVDEVRVFSPSDQAAWLIASMLKRKHKADDAWPERL